MIKKKVMILGGGLAGLSVGYFHKENDIAIVEKQGYWGGLARSFPSGDIVSDIGPHIFFSKNQKVLDFMRSLTPCVQHVRSNMILHGKDHVKYPFENFLGMIQDPKDRHYCVNSFLNNPYKDYEPENMLQFFLKKFGEGITNLYLRPYNEKIWKFDPSYMDTKMVDRIPDPPAEDIISGAQGNYKEGYTHQLYFYYPEQGGTQSLIDGLKTKVEKKIGADSLYCEQNIQNIKATSDGWEITTDKALFFCEQLINCMPIHQLIPLLDVPNKKQLAQTLSHLHYNSIYICTIGVQKDLCGANWTFTLADKNVIFHRINKLNFLGPAYQSAQNEVTYLAEITFREHDIYDQLSQEELHSKIIQGLLDIGFIQSASQVNYIDYHKEKYAYVIYDLFHSHYQKQMMELLAENNIPCVGRFAQFMYFNMDRVIEEAMNFCENKKTSSLDYCEIMC